MKKLLTSDYDRTFFEDEESIKDNIKKVKEFRDKGNIFVIATGRAYHHFIKELDKYDIKYDYLIINHGATILDKKHRIIKNYSINNDIKEDIKHEFKLEDNEDIFSCKGLKSITSINEKDITKIHIKCNSKEEQLKFDKIIKTKYKDFAKSYPITGPSNSIEIISSNTDKSIAIKDIAKLENIEENKIFTIGDSFNDLEMLEAFNGYCMLNSEEFIKSKISQKCKSVGEVIDKIIGGLNE